MLVYEYKPDFRFRKSSKDAKFGQCRICGVPALLWAEPMRRWVDSTFKIKYYAYTDAYRWPAVNAYTEDHCPRDEKKSRLRTHIYPRDLVKISVAD